MAQKRMFSKRITNSARFLKLPLSAQALYFHLSMDTDDDGIVEAYKILMVTKASEGDFQILVDHSLIKILNDDLVTFITDWHEHNNIRADRKIDSIHKNLLVCVAPDIKLIKAKKRADTNEKTRKHIIDTGRPLDVQRTAQISIDKVSIDKSREDIDTPEGGYNEWKDKVHSHFIKRYSEHYNKDFVFGKKEWSMLALRKGCAADDFIRGIDNWFKDKWGSQCGHDFMKMCEQANFNKLTSASGAPKRAIGGVKEDNIF